MSGRAGHDGVDGRLTGTRAQGDGEPTGWNLWDARNSGHVELYLESLRHMKAIPSYPLLKQRTVCHADTPRHGHGSLPRTEAAPTERTRHASGYGCSRAAQWLLYHRLPDPQLSPVAITPTTGWRIRTLCRKARWPPRSNERVSSV